MSGAAKEYLEEAIKNAFSIPWGTTPSSDWLYLGEINTGNSIYYLYEDTTGTEKKFWYETKYDRMEREKEKIRRRERRCKRN